MARCGSFGTSCGITDGAKISLGLLVRQKLAHSYASSGNRGAIVGCCDRALRLYGGFRFCGAGRTDKEGDQTKGYAPARRFLTELKPRLHSTYVQLSHHVTEACQSVPTFSSAVH